MNLGLAVVRKRADGYHDIDTVFQTISLADTISLSRREDQRVSLSSTGLQVPSGDGNLAYRAAALVRERSDAGGVSIALTKRIPVGAGLGGGSADAAATIVGMNEIWELGLSGDDMAGLALEVGSDVPFLVGGGTARGRSRGEMLDPLPALTGLYFVLVKPDFEVSAGEAYRQFRIRLTDSGAFIRLICNAIQHDDLERLERELHNDLEAGAVSVYPEIREIAAALREHGASAAVMCGSGPTVLGTSRRKEEAEAIASSVSRRGWSTRIVEPVAAGCRILS